MLFGSTCPYILSPHFLADFFKTKFKYTSTTSRTVWASWETCTRLHHRLTTSPSKPILHPSCTLCLASFCFNGCTQYGFITFTCSQPLGFVFIVWLLAKALFGLQTLWELCVTRKPWRRCMVHNVVTSDGSLVIEGFIERVFAVIRWQCYLTCLFQPQCIDFVCHINADVLLKPCSYRGAVCKRHIERHEIWQVMARTYESFLWFALPFFFFLFLS